MTELTVEIAASRDLQTNFRSDATFVAFEPDFGTPSLSALLVKHAAHALGIEWLPALVEMTSLGEGGCDLP